MSYTAISDIVVPTIFTPYMMAMTEVKNNLVLSGALARDPALDKLLDGGGKTFNVPTWRDLADTAANVSTGTAGSAATPLNITSHTEVAVRLSRNQSWGSPDLAAALAGEDPMDAIAQRVARYWAQQAQLAILAMLKGVFADNAANDSSDMIKDISASAYAAGSTDFSADAFIDAVHTMGDSEADLGIIMMHSVVYARAKKNNLIDFAQDSANALAARFGTFLGRTVVVDDGLPVSSGVYTSYILGTGSLRWGVSTPKVPTEVYRLPLDANGGGTEALTTRVEWAFHLNGMKYAGTAADGGPSNAATSNNLGAAGSWDRVRPERKQIKAASLISREA